MPYVEGRTVGEQQKNSTFKPHLEGRTVGRQRKNQRYKKRKVVLKRATFFVCWGNDFDLEKGGKTQQKLMALPFLHELLYNNCVVGNFINSGIYIRADYFVGNTKAILSVGFKYGKKVDFPVTLYKEDVRKMSQPTNKVLAIFRRNYAQINYSECTYLSKGQEIGKLQIDEDIKKMIDVV